MTANASLSCIPATCSCTIFASDCKTEQGSHCVFPFTYKGVTYKTCTTTESDNGAAWCATQVDSEGVVVNNQWQDCVEVRPRMSLPHSALTLM